MVQRERLRARAFGALVFFLPNRRASNERRRLSDKSRRVLKPRFVSERCVRPPLCLRADVEVPLGGDLIHAERLHVARRVQNLRRARALVQRHHLGFVPHPVVGPIQLAVRWFVDVKKSRGAREARRRRSVRVSARRSALGARNIKKPREGRKNPKKPELKPACVFRPTVNHPAFSGEPAPRPFQKRYRIARENRRIPRESRRFDTPRERRVDAENGSARARRTSRVPRSGRC